MKNSLESDTWLSAQALHDISSIRFVDARVGARAADAFCDAHLVGAVRADLERDLSCPGPDPSEGGRHPLPALDVFCAFLGRSGIGPTTPVVAYDDAGGAKAAARFWWMLRALGHGQVAVLDGGLSAALEAGLPMEQGAAQPRALPPYPAPVNWLLPTARREDVARIRADPQRALVDVRSPERFRGESEPLDPIAGHIPGAINLPFSENLDGRGHFLSDDALRTRYDAALLDSHPEQIVVHCGSGVTACHTLLALHRLKVNSPALYVGSWSEWCRSSEPRNP